MSECNVECGEGPDIKHWRSRAILFSKAMAFALMLCFIFLGHPPANARVYTPGPEDANLSASIQELQTQAASRDTSIEFLKSVQVSNAETIAAMQATANKQGEELASLDTKITCLMAVLGLLQGGGILLTLYPLKRRGADDRP